jgi:hypothetical protein
MTVAGALVVSWHAIGATAHDRITTKVTWNREIAPIIQARCAGCHSPGQSSTISLTTYEEARPWAASIKEEVLTRRMPIWNAARGYGDFANDPSLSPFEIALVVAWADGGAPERSARDNADAAAAPAARPGASGSSPTRTTRIRTLRCGTHALTGRLLAVRPQLDKGASAGIAAILPGDRREILAWIRNYDPAFPTTYWLRNPLDLPAGSRLHVESPARCSIDVTLGRE